jgi:pimeloyl-ACP methyl ester carboxylesterase
MVALSSGVRVRVAESGPADGSPVVLLHGWGASLYMFRHALALLPSSGFRTIAVDLRGYGLSDHPLARGAYSLDNYLRDVEALFAALQLERAALVGQSMGGAVALHYALRHPSRVTKLVLINPVGLVPIGWVSLMRFVPQMLMDRAGQRAIPRWLTRWILRHVAYSDAALVTPHDVDENWGPTQQPGFAHAVRACIGEFDWAPLDMSKVSSLSVPALVVLGTRDRVVRHAASAAARLHGARVLELDGGHCVHEEHPTEVYGAIAEFLTI